MKLNENIEIIDLALYLKKENTLVISDLHLGFEKEMQTRGILLPPFQFKQIKERLGKIFYTLEARGRKLGAKRPAQHAKPHKFENIIINGDLKHEFGRISAQEWDEILELINLLEKHCKKIVIIKGQHDVILDRITNKKNIKLLKDFSKNKIFITHGHKIPGTKKFRESRILIIGNEHPAISISDGTVSHTYKCFLKGKFKNKALIVQPSFCLAVVGTDISKESVISPFLKQDLRNFEVFVAADEIRYFGKLKNIENP